MASINLSGILRDSLGEIDVGALIRFTHVTTTGEVLATTEAEYIIPPDGTYSIDVQYGQVRVDYTTRFTENFVAIVIVNGDSTATNLPDLLNAAVPPTDAQLLQFQGILADAQAAAVTSEAFADQLTTLDLIASAATFAPDTNIRTKGYTTSGDGGSGHWLQNGVTGQTPSQTSLQLGNQSIFNDANGDQWGYIVGSAPLNPISKSGYGVTTTSNVITDSSAIDSDIFIDSLRLDNFHTTGAAIGTHTFLIPDNKFRLPEASRSYDKKIGTCERVLFVGDSLTAYVGTDGSYTSTVSEKLSNEHGGIKEVGYLAAESVGVSAKQNFFGLDVGQSGFTYLNAGAFLYTSDERKFSPDGKGATITAADGSRFYHWNVNSVSTVRYTKYKIYYLQQPTGGTFDIRNRGATLNPIDTVGTLSLQSEEFVFVDNGDPLNKDVRVENVTGDVTIYGVELIDELTTSGYSYDTFATSGGELRELLQLQSSSLQTICTARDYDTVVINIGTNDSTGGVSATDFITSLNTYISNITASLPDVKFVITTPNNMQWTNFTGSTRALYEDARREYCRDNELMYIDTCSEIGNFNYFVSRDMMRDGTHPNIKGEEYIGLMVAGKIINNKAETLTNPIVNETLSSSVLQSYCTFHANGGTLVVVNEVGCTVSRVGVGIYDVTFTDDLADAFYSVISEVPQFDFISAIPNGNKGVSKFRVLSSDLATTPTDFTSANPYSVSVIGRSKPRL
jgi:lysophospholipase L1-like esterase